MINLAKHSLCFAAMLVAVFAIMGVSPAHAAGLDLDTCATGFQPWDYTAKVVTCITNALRQAARTMAGDLVSYFRDTVYAMVVLAIAWHGVKILGGERQMVQNGLSLLLRAGIVFLVYSNVGAFVDTGLGVYNWVIQLFTGGYSPWIRVDRLIGKLIGMGPSLVLAQGLIGIIGAALLSSTAGIFMFMAGFMALLDFFFFLFNVVFIYLMSFTLVAFMLALTPLFAPLLIFFYTEQYFNKWWHIMVSATLVPTLMFAFLLLFLGIFNQLIADLFDILGFPCSNPANFTTCTPPDYRAYWKMNQPAFSWMMPADPHSSQQMQAITSATDLSNPAVQSNVNPLLRRGFDKGMINTPGVDFGPNHVKITEQLMFAFISLWIFSTLMKSFLGKIPHIADDISGALNRITVEPTQIESTLRQHMHMNPDQMQAKAGSISGTLKETLSRARSMVTGKNQV